MEFNATFIISALSFILFTIIMNSIFYKPLRRISEARNSYIENNYNEADSVNRQANSILDEKNQKISKVQQDMRAKISDGIELSKKNKQNLIADAVKSSKSQIETEKENLLQSKIEVMDALKNQIDDFSKDISDKVLGQNSFSNSVQNDEAVKNV